MIFHLETIPDEDLQEIAGSLNLSTVRSRADLTRDILAYYAHLEGMESNQDQARTRTRSTSRNGDRYETDVVLAATRGISRLDHPSCAGRSRYIGDELHLEENSPRPSNPRISLRSVLQRWEEIGLMEEQGRSSGRSPRSSLGGSRRSSTRSSTNTIYSDALSRQGDTERLSGGEYSLFDYNGTHLDSHVRRSTGSAGSPPNQPVHGMRLRDRHTEAAHPMQLRQRRLSIADPEDAPETRTLATPDARNERRSTAGANYQISVTGSTLTDRSFLRVLRTPTSYGQYLSDSPSDMEYWDLISISGEEEEEEEFAGYGLEAHEIREHTVEGRFRELKRPKLDKTASGEPSTVEQPASQNEEARNVCPICLENFKEKERIRTLPCFHIYHVRCIDRWLKSNSKCPICKNSVL